ncbi:MAG: IS110 family transposase, partial [Micromonosporaceae bacterium]
MTSMPDAETTVVGGADTHADTLHLAAVDEHCRPLADLAAPANPDGHAKALEFFTRLGRLAKVGVE